MWGAIAGALMAAGGSALNAIKQSREAKKQRLFLEKRQKENEDNYNNSKYDHTQSAAAQYDRTQSDKALQEAVGATNGAVTGGDLDRAKILGKAMEARAQRDAQITASGEAQERADRDAYLQRKDSIENAQMQLSAQQAANSAAAMQSVVNAGSQLAMADISSSMQSGKGVFGDGKAVDKTGGETAGAVTGNAVGTGVSSPNVGSAIKANTFGGDKQGSVYGLKLKLGEKEILPAWYNERMNTILKLRSNSTI